MFAVSRHMAIVEFISVCVVFAWFGLSLFWFSLGVVWFWFLFVGFFWFYVFFGGGGRLSFCLPACFFVFLNLKQLVC